MWLEVLMLICPCTLVLIPSRYWLRWFAWILLGYSTSLVLLIAAMHPQGQPNLDALLSTPEGQKVVYNRVNEEIRHHSDNAEAWYWGAKLLFAREQYTEADEAIKQALLYHSNDDKHLLSLQIRYFIEGSQFDDSSREQAIALLHQSPSTVLLTMLGMDAYQHQHFSKAKEYWQRAREHTKDSSQLRMLDAAISQAQLAKRPLPQ